MNPTLLAEWLQAMHKLLRQGTVELAGLPGLGNVITLRVRWMQKGQHYIISRVISARDLEDFPGALHPVFHELLAEVEASL